MNRLGMIGFAGLFSGTFWQGFRYQTPQAIEDELKKDVPSLRVLLNEEDIIQEVKNGSNQKLQDFLAKNLNELIEYITVMPESDEHERGHKFPFVVSEILNCDCAPILDAFFQPPQEKPEPKEEEPKEDAHDDLTESWLNAGKHKDEDDDDDQDDTNKQFEHDEDDSGPMVVKNQKVEDAQPETEDNEEAPESGDALPQVVDQEVGDDKPEEEAKAETTVETSDKSPVKAEAEAEAEIGKEPEQEEGEKVEVSEKESEEAKEMQQAKEEIEEKEEKEEKEDKEEKEEKDEKNEEGQEEQEHTQEGEKEESGGLFDEQEEKIHGSMTQDSTTCFSKERSKYESIDKLFEFVAPQRPASSASSLASEATNVTAQTEETPESNELNPVLCGYFAKLVMHFVMKRPKEFFLYVSERPQVLHNMVGHIYSRAIADSLIRVLTCENHGLQDSSTFGDYNELRNSVVEEVLQQISEKSMPWTMQNAANIVTDLAMRRSFFDVLVTPGYLHILFDVLFGEGEDVHNDKRNRLPHIRRHGLRILSTLMGQFKANLMKDQNKEEDKKEEEKKESEKNKSPANFGDDDDVIIGDEEESPEKKSPKKLKDDPEEEEAPSTTASQESKEAPSQQEEKKETEAPQEKEEANPFVEELVKQTDKLIALLDLQPPQSVDTISGAELQPFGPARLSIVEMIGDVIKLNVVNLNAKIIQTNVMKKLLQFFGKYEWNSLLHFKLDLIFSEVLRNHETGPELLKALFEESHFLNYITQLIRSEDYQLKNETGRRIERGFMPYIIRFIDTLEGMREKSTYIDQQIKKFGEEEWTEVWKDKIQPKKNKYAKQLGGHNPNQKQIPMKKEEDTLTSSINSKYTSYEKGDKETQKTNEDVDQPEEDILNKRETEDDDDDDTDLGSRRTQMLGSIDNSGDKHRNLYIQTTTQDDDEPDSSFKAWNVSNPEDELQKEKEKKGPGLTMEELSNEFDFARVEEEKFDDFDSQRVHDEGFSADEFGEYQKGEEFFDAQGPEEAREVGANEDEDYNDYNFWKVDVGANYDLDKLMRDM